MQLLGNPQRLLGQRRGWWQGRRLPWTPGALFVNEAGAVQVNSNGRAWARAA